VVELAASGQALPSPVEAYFEVANRCNSRCSTCPLTFSPQEAAASLSYADFCALVAQLPDLKRAVLQGIGEPLLNRDLAGMIRHLKERGVYVVFNTNAVLLTKRRQVELLEAGLDELRISLDAARPETYLELRGIPAFERVVANTAQLVRTRTELGRTSPRVAIWMTGLQANLAELPALVDLAAELGVDEVYLQRLVYGFAAPAQALAKPEQSLQHEPADWVHAVLEDAERRAEQHGLPLRASDGRRPTEAVVLPDELGAEPWRGCSRPLRLAYVTAQGTALPCCIAPFTEAPYASFVLGNYLEQGVAQVWNGPAYQQFRQQLYSSTPPPACRHCGLAWSL